MSDPLPRRVTAFRSRVDAMAAGLWPSLSVEDRRARMLAALGIDAVAPWRDRMLWIDAQPKG